MKIKIQTPSGYLYLPDKCMAENIAVVYDKIPKRKNIDMIVITSDDAKKAYRTANPFGIGYTDCFDCVLASHRSRMKLNAEKPERKIDFLEIS